LSGFLHSLFRNILFSVCLSNVATALPTEW
jgi:hypothetical protein